MCLTKKRAIAKILKPHGLRGGVKARVFSNDIDIFKCNKSFFIKGDLHVVEFMKSLSLADVIIKFKEINDFGSAESYRNIFLFLCEEAPVVSGERPFVEALIGMRVYSLAGELVGRIKEYQEGSDGGRKRIGGAYYKGFYKICSMDGGMEWLMPTDSSLFSKIDREGGSVTLGYELLRGDIV